MPVFQTCGHRDSEAVPAVAYLCVKQVLPELVGHTRTSVNRVLKRLEADGLVQVGYGQIEILDPTRLAKIAGLE